MYRAKDAYMLMNRTDRGDVWGWGGWGEGGVRKVSQQIQVKLFGRRVNISGDIDNDDYNDLCASMSEYVCCAGNSPL